VVHPPRTLPSNDTTIQSVDRAITILEFLAEHGEMGVTEVAVELGVHRSTAFRLLAALERRGLAEQVSVRGKYRLGSGLLQLARSMITRMDFTQLTRPACEWLAGEVGDTVNVAILEADSAVNVAQVRGSAAITSDNWIGQRTPLHATSSGKVLLAYLPPSEQDRLLENPLESFTPDTLTDPDLLRADLEMVRARGYAVTSEELEIGLNAVAAPIRSHDGVVAAAISVSGPSYRLSPDAIASAAEAVCNAAALISDRLRFHPDLA